MAVPRGATFPNKINALSRLTPDSVDIENIGAIPALANRLTPEQLDSLGLWPPKDPPNENAAPAGPRNGASKAKEVAKLQDEIYDLLADLPNAELSVLDRPLGVTVFSDVRARKLQRQDITLHDLAKLIRTTVAPGKSALPLLKLGQFGDIPTTKGSLRHDANMGPIDGIEGDYDAGEVTIGEAVERLKAAGIAALLYTTPSHRPDLPRWRVLAPTSETLPLMERDAVAARLNGALGGILAPETFTRSQAYYFGGVEAAPEVVIINGRAIDKVTTIKPIGRAPSESDDLDLLADLADPVTTDDDEEDLLSFIEPDWERIKRALAVIPADGRAEWLKVGMALHAESRGSEVGLKVWSEWSKASDKYKARDQVNTWQSFGDRSREVTRIGSLFALAKEHGWGDKPAPVVAGRLTFLSPDECQMAPSRGYVIKGILAPGDVGCIFGAPGAGKSLIAPYLGYRMSQGESAFAMRTKAGGVFYVAAEDPHGMRGRITALKLRHGAAPEFTLVDGVSDLLTQGSGDLAALMAAVRERKPSLIFVDTLAMAFPGLEENSADGMGRVVAVARKLTKYGAAVVLIHHDTKAEGSTPRGHSLLNGALDMAMHVSRVGDGIVRGKLTKNRNGSCDQHIAFTIDALSLGDDEDGDPINVALVNELASDPGPRREPLSPSARAALSILLDCEADSPDKADCPGVLESYWREACVNGRTLSGSEDPESRKRAFRRAFKELAVAGKVLIQGDYVILVKPKPHIFDDGLEDLND